jgi:tetratricopeptide (TPR) repeat protein
MIFQDDAGADKWIARATRLNVVDPENWVLAGMLELRRGGADEGLAAFEKAVSLNPTRPASYFDAGVSLFEDLPILPADRRPFFRDLAQANLARSLNLSDFFRQDPNLCMALASIMAEKGDTVNAVLWAKRIVLPSPVYWPFAIEKLALCFSLGERVEAISEWQHLFVPANITSAQVQLISSELNKYSTPDFDFMRAEIDLLQGRLDSAQRELSRLVTVRPNMADYRIALGNVDEKLGRRDEARLCYEKALELSPANQEAKNKLMQIYSRGKF